MAITIGAIIKPSKIPNLNHNRFNGCNKLDFTKLKTKKIKHTIKDQSLICSSLIRGHKEIIRNKKKKVKAIKVQLGKKKETAREKMIGQTIGYRYDVNLLPDYKKLTPFLKKYIEHMGWDDLNWLEDVHMGYEEDKPAVFDRNANGWVTIPKKIKLPASQQDRDMIARELLVKFQMSPNHPLVDLKKAYLKF